MQAPRGAGATRPRSAQSSPQPPALCALRRAAGATLAAAASVVLLQHAPAWAAAPGQQPSGAAAAAAEAPPRVLPCTQRGGCVSTASFLSPGNYLPPWSFAPAGRDAAARALLRALEDAGAGDVRVDEAGDATVVSAKLPLGRAGAGDAVFALRADGVALFRLAAAGGGGGVDPPGCLRPGCISGSPAQRRALESLRDGLGWTPLEPDEDGEKKWVQILLH
ncbi:hypothetical protein Rsub_05938 [Raphidocelis subcapitata]|uniref:Uncharacterized protein n=1 Tax=Raphidocelis subcapitata TaxID=307507 RepID=A0A2V0P009_9CHLO|nr:hypothetical protein Rsub_05938 [Raphidocelis subcapitata]|eukprot:GBF93206.1 hypothetical protein Rsub_05938 [Raphidocelis subcapitata]